jgi:hypothetical protein
MSSVSAIRDGFPGGNRRSFIATEAFATRFFTYSTSNVDGVTTGSLEVVTTNDALCPKGRILRENGRKLFPGANPGITQYYVGVYDSVSPFLSGFIDPNAPTFAIFNTDKANYIENNSDPVKGEDLGNPVYTDGNIETLGGYVKVTRDNSYGLIYASSTQAYLELSTNTGYVKADASNGLIRNSGLLNPYNACGQIVLPGSSPNNRTVDLPLLTTTTNPLIFLSRNTLVGTAGTLTYTIGTAPTALSTLTINSSSTNESSAVNYLLISDA